MHCFTNFINKANKAEKLDKISQLTRSSVRPKSGLKPLLPEPQFQLYKLIKRCQQTKNCNCCRTLPDKTEKKLYTLGRNELEWHEKVTASNKQHKIGLRNTFGRWDVRDVGRSGCGTWDVECLPECGMLIYKIPWFIAGLYVTF